MNGMCSGVETAAGDCGISTIALHDRKQREQCAEAKKTGPQRLTPRSADTA